MKCKVGTGFLECQSYVLDFGFVWFSSFCLTFTVFNYVGTIFYYLAHLIWIMIEYFLLILCYVMILWLLTLISWSSLIHEILITNDKREKDEELKYCQNHSWREKRQRENSMGIHSQIHL